MSNGIVEYHVEIDGSEVTLVIHAMDADAATAIANTLTAQLKSGLLDNEEVPDE